MGVEITSELLEEWIGSHRQPLQAKLKSKFSKMTPDAINKWFDKETVKELKHDIMMNLYYRVLEKRYGFLGDPLRYSFDPESRKLLDKKIEVLKAILNGIPDKDIPGFQDVLELYSPDNTAGCYD